MSKGNKFLHLKFYSIFIRLKLPLYLSHFHPYKDEQDLLPIIPYHQLHNFAGSTEDEADN